MPFPAALFPADVFPRDLFPVPTEPGEITVPTKPATPTGTVGHAQIALAWTANAPGELVTLYTIERSDGGAYAVVGTSAMNAYTDTTPTPGTAYTYQVIATNSEGDSDASDASDSLEAWPAYIYQSRSIDLNGSTQYATAPQAIAEAIVDEGAVLMWVRPDFLPAEGANRIFVYASMVSGYLGIQANTTANRLYLVNNSRVAYGASTGLWVAGQFICLIGQWKKSTDTMELFINGTSLGSLTKSGTWGSSTISAALGLGASASGSSKLDGAIGRVCIWSSLRTAPQIAALQYQLPLLAAPAGRVFEWAPGGSVQNLMDADSVVTLVGSPPTVAGPPKFRRNNNLLMM